MRITLTLAALMLAVPATVHAQGGFLKKMKEKAAEKVVQKAGEAVSKVAGGKDSASAAADSTKAQAAAKEAGGRATKAAAPSRADAGTARRTKALDPTVLESARDEPGANAQAQQASASEPAQGQDELSKKGWSGTAIAMDKFAGSIPTITDASLDAYIRARTAMHAEAKRVYASVTGTREQRLAAKALEGAPLADDEKVVLLEYQPYLKISRKLKRQFERRLDAVMERELNGAMTRMQFYQLHEMVSMFLNDEVNTPGAKGPGRGLTKPEIAALEKRKADLLRLRTESINEV